jgi:hypothetical protein
VGTLCLILDLHTPNRFYNMLRLVKTTSPMSLGSWGLIGFSIMSSVTAALQFVTTRLSGSWLRGLARIAQWPAALGGGFMSIYTASLLSATSTPTLMASARQFVPHDRGEAMSRKWLSRLDIHALGEDRMVAVMADATLLATDLLLSYPAASGATAFDRLARSSAAASAAEAALITALRQARFRLLRVSCDADAVTAYDILSGDAVQIVGAALPSQVRGAALFARVVMMATTGVVCRARSRRWTRQPVGLNIIDLDTYLNHSPHPNLRTKDGVRFVTTRRVQEDGELTVNYQTYGARLC